MSLQRTLVPLTLLLAAPLALAQNEGGDGYGQKKSYGQKKDGYEAAPLTAEQTAELRASFARLMETRGAMPVSDEPCCAEDAPCDACETIEGDSRSVVKTLVSHPSSWEVVTPLVRETFLAAQTTVGQRDLVLQVMGWTGSERALEIGAELWKDGAQHFTDEHVLVLAENGCEPLWEEVCKRARKASAGGDVRAAVLVSMRAAKYAEKEAYAGKKKKAAYASEKSGDAAPEIDVKQLERDAKQAKKALVAAARVREIDPATALDALLAGACLDELGEAGSLRSVQEKVHGAVIAALDAGELERARHVALTADFVHEAANSYGKMELGYLGERLKAHSFARSKEVATADQVFELIERITPL